MQSRNITIDAILRSKAGRLNQHLTKLLPGQNNGLNQPKKAKYGNKWREVDGHKFQSKKEAKRYGELKILLKKGEIGLLELQKVFLLIPKNEKERKCKYLADFVYLNAKTGEQVVEDVKSKATRKLSTYIIKRKLMKSVYGIEIKEV